ncbi:hypothetical protein V8G54_008712 [Vigna mungo]|uniref:Uncharacterized protein n=1 Tax=Vigna mungo TaxID=3915 RepID=A0AAQ3P4D1_VIGMU
MEAEHHQDASIAIGSLYVKVMTDEQMELLRQQISVYATICEQLVEMHKAITTQQDLAGLRLGNLYCDPLMACSGHKITARQRWTPTPLQLQILERIFDEGNGTPSKQKIKEITIELGQHGQISETNVYNWFQNRRARSKRKQLAPAANVAEPETETEVDSPREKKIRAAESVQVVQPFENSSPHRIKDMYIHSPDLEPVLRSLQLEKKPHLSHLAGNKNRSTSQFTAMAAPNMDQFEAYFRRADLDGDGRISGAEAVSFFMGSNLPKQVLAQVWAYADQAKTGFLGRAEFFNALRLVTVAQSKRDLTPDIVKAALYGPAAAKIPAPQINLASVPQPVQNARPHAVSVGQMGVTAPNSAQGFAYRGQGLAGPGANPQYHPSQQNPAIRPHQSMPVSGAPHPHQGVAGPDISRGVNMGGHNFSNPGLSNDWNKARPGMVATRPAGMNPSAALQTSQSPVSPMPQSSSVSPMSQLSPVSPMPQSTTVHTKALSVSGNGFSSNPVLGNDFFSAASSTPKQEPAGHSYSVTNVSSAIVPVSTGPQPANKQNSLDSLQGAFSSVLPANSQFQRPQSAPNQQIKPQASSPHTPSGMTGGVGNANSDNVQLSWPKMKPTDVQKYTKVFLEVDTDRDGKITGEQARSLFLSWRLPIEVLKKVWDLSDQDNDSMLSLKEFCFALYLMERYREGRPLPQSLPSNVMFDETLMSMTGQPKNAPGNAAWGISQGFQQQQQGMPGARPVVPTAGFRPPVHGSSAQADFTTQPNQQKSGTPVLEDSFLNRTDSGEQNTSNTKPQDATTAEKKPPIKRLFPCFCQNLVPVERKGHTSTGSQLFGTPFRINDDCLSEEAQNVILDSKEKMELYRNKMQELAIPPVAHFQAESLGKKYEEKYKQVAEIASKLTVEEAKFRDIQQGLHWPRPWPNLLVIGIRKDCINKGWVEGMGVVDCLVVNGYIPVEEGYASAFYLYRHYTERKVELQQAIVKIEQGGSADGILQKNPQVRAERIQSDLEELFKALVDRCKKHGIDVKSITMVQLPAGWQPGIPEGAALWDEEWDKFEDEGFANDLTFATKKASSKPKPVSIDGEQNFSDDNSIHGSPMKANGKQENSANGDYTVEDYAHSEEDLARSPHDSLAGRSTLESPSQVFSNADFGKGSEADAETHSVRHLSSNYDVIIYGNRSFDESTWAFDNNDDEDSVWGFKTKDSDFDQGDFFKSDDFGINPIRTGSTHTDSTFQTKSPFTFDDSVPATPVSKFENSPRYSEAGDHFFDMSRFDSFRHESGYSPQPERLTRFDSINSSKDFGFGNDKFTRFDSVSSSKDFGFGNDKFTRFDSISSSKDFGNSNDQFTRFDSISGSKDFGYSPEKLQRFDSMSSNNDFGFGGQGHARFDSISSTKDFGPSGAFTFDDSDPFGSSGPFKVSSENHSPKKGSDNWSAF